MRVHDAAHSMRETGVRENKVRAICASGDAAVTAWLGAASPYLAEVTGHLGFDCVTIDMQHGILGIETAIACMQALSSTPAMPMVRLPANDPAVIMHVLDAGAYGLICPMISTAEEAARFVDACLYPPLGSRSFGPQRGVLYGGADYVEHANSQILKLAMIETPQGNENFEAILRTPHLDGLYIGPNDFSLALGGKPSCEPVEPHVREAIARIVKATRASGKICGIFSSDGETAVMRASEGFNFLTPGGDLSHYKSGATEAIAAARGGKAGSQGGY
jgi:4-hydroxy-2-oxoheptanedioate aldolase